MKPVAQKSSITTAVSQTFPLMEPIGRSRVVITATYIIKTGQSMAQPPNRPRMALWAHFQRLSPWNMVRHPKKMAQAKSTTART